MPLRWSDRPILPGWYRETDLGRAAEAHEHSVAPLDEEMLSELAKVPAVVEGKGFSRFRLGLELWDFQKFASGSESDWKLENLAI